jgi:hypothetical protein
MRKLEAITGITLADLKVRLENDAEFRERFVRLFNDEQREVTINLTMNVTPIIPAKEIRVQIGKILTDAVNESGI